MATKFVPDLLSYFKLKATKFTMRFPHAGPARRCFTSKGKHIMKMTGITFTYPGRAQSAADQRHRARLPVDARRLHRRQRRGQVYDDQAADRRADPRQAQLW